MPRYFVIREKGSDKFIPLPQKHAYGYTQQELTNDPNRIPRLFLTGPAAAGALREWLKGHQYNEWDQDYYAGPFLRDTPHRIKDDMEILEVEITI